MVAKRYQNDLRLIVGVNEDAGGIDGQEEKGPIGGGRGIMYFTANGDSQFASGSSPGSGPNGDSEGDLPPDTSTGDDEDSNGGNQYDADNNNGGNLEQPGPHEIGSTPDTGAPSVNNLSVGQVVPALSGLKDCATDQPIDVRLDGQYTAPEGWDGPESPPPADYRQACIDKFGFEGCNYLQPTVFSDGSATCRTSRCGIVGSITANEAPQPATQWPSEKNSQLSYNRDTGLYEISSFDGNALPEYSQPVSGFTLCNEQGQTIKSFRLADNGQALLNEDTGIAAFFDENGKVTGFGSSSEITARQPR